MNVSDHPLSFVNLIPKSYGECGMRQQNNFQMESHDLAMIIVVIIHLTLLFLGMN